MTFEQMAAQWRDLPSDEYTREVLPSDAHDQFIRDLRAPDRRGWFMACRAWVNGGPSPDDYPEIGDILASLDGFTRAVAQAHLHCTRAACKARELAPPVENAPLSRREADTEVVKALLEAACKAIALSSAQPALAELTRQLLQAHWPSGRATAAVLADTAFRLLAQQLGPALPPSVAARDLTAELLEAPRQPSRELTLTGLLVSTGSGEEHGEGFTADLVLQGMPDGNGLLYPTPALAFVHRDDQFLGAEVDACTHVRKGLWLWPENWDVRWCLQRRDGYPLPLGLMGDSLGLAFSVGLAKLFVGE